MALDAPVSLHVCEQEMHTVHTDNLGATRHIAKAEKKKGKCAVFPQIAILELGTGVRSEHKMLSNTGTLHSSDFAICMAWPLCNGDSGERQKSEPLCLQREELGFTNLFVLLQFQD